MNISIEYINITKIYQNLSNSPITSKSSVQASQETNNSIVVELFILKLQFHHKINDFNMSEDGKVAILHQ